MKRASRAWLSKPGILAERKASRPAAVLPGLQLQDEQVVCGIYLVLQDSLCIRLTGPTTLVDTCRLNIIKGSGGWVSRAADWTYQLR